MSKHGSMRAVLAGLAIVVLAGCSGAPTRTAPDIPGESSGSTSAGANSPASSATQATSARPSASSATGARPSASSAKGARPSAGSAAGAQPGSAGGAQPGSAGGPPPGSAAGPQPSSAPNPFVQADSIPFPVAVGNTWVYRTTAVGQTGQTTIRIVAAGAVPAGYQVALSSSTDVPGAVAAIQPVYMFYPDGTVGFSVPPLTGLSAVGGGIRWPDAAALASGQAHHSVVRLQVSQTGRYEDANVTVQGAGTTTVRVPAGTYQASVVNTIIAANAVTVTVTTWIAQGIGPVRTEVVIRTAGTTELTTNELLSFTKGIAVGIGS